MTSVNTKLRILKRMNEIKKKGINKKYEESQEKERQNKEDKLNNDKVLKRKFNALLKAEASFEKALLDKYKEKVSTYYTKHRGKKVSSYIEDDFFYSSKSIKDLRDKKLDKLEKLYSKTEINILNESTKEDNELRNFLKSIEGL